MSSQRAIDNPVSKNRFVRPVAWNGIDGVEFTLESHGLRIAIWLDDPDLLDAAASELPPGSRFVNGGEADRTYRLANLPAELSPAEFAGYQLLADGELTARGYGDTPSRHLLTSLESSLEHYVAEYSAEHLFVHAGVVAWRDRAIVLPGRSFAGKSTLVHGLVDAGATYYSDEFAVIDREGRVHPYARRLSLREGPFGPAGRVKLAPDDLDRLRPLPVAMVAFLKYEAEATWSVESLHGAGAILEVCDHTVAIRRRPADAFAMIGAMVAPAIVIKGARGDVRDATRTLLDLLDRNTNPA